MISILDAEESRRLAIDEYKLKLKENVLTQIKEKLFENPVIIDFLETFKKAEKAKKELELHSTLTLESQKVFVSTFDDSRMMNFKYKQAKKDVFWDCFNFGLAVRNLSDSIQTYGTQTASLIDKSSQKEKETMQAIRNSFEEFFKLNMTYFGQEINSHYSKAMTCQNELRNHEHEFKTFEIDNLLLKEEIEMIAKDLDTDYCTGQEVYDWIALSDNKSDIWNHFLRMKAKVKICLKKQETSAWLFFSMDDYIYRKFF